MNEAERKAHHTEEVVGQGAYQRVAQQTVDPSPQHLGTCRRCNQTYLLGTNCGDEDHLPKK